MEDKKVVVYDLGMLKVKAKKAAVEKKEGEEEDDEFELEDEEEEEVEQDVIIAELIGHSNRFVLPFLPA